MWKSLKPCTFKFRKRKKILSSLVYHVYVLHTIWQINRAFSRRSRAVRVKKCTKKCVVRCRVVVLLIKNLLLFFWRSRCRRRRRTLSRDLINDDDGNGNMKKGNGFNPKNNNSERASRFSVNFVAIPELHATWNDKISDLTIRQRTTSMKTSLKNRLRILSNVFAIIRIRTVTQKKGILVGA